MEEEQERVVSGELQIEIGEGRREEIGAGT